MEEASKNDTLVLIGETGSGKTTQVPQFLHEAKLHFASKDCRRIVISQPRRVAAITLAQRVAQEMGMARHKVGYKVRFEDSTHPQQTEIEFQTDGMLLREAMMGNVYSNPHNIE